MAEDVYVYIDEPPAAAPRRAGPNPWLIGCIAAVVVVLVGLAALGLLIESGRLPDSAVVAGHEVEGRMRERLYELEVLGPDDDLHYFYSWGLFDITAGGSALTSAGVVMWYEDESEPLGCRLDVIPFAAIQGARLAREGGVLEEALIEVETANLEYYVPVSAEGDGHRRFLDELLRIWTLEGGWRPDEVPASFEAEFADLSAEEDR